MDNRIRFQAPRIDFATDVGLTGQDHDNYPEPNSQARYDWLRMVVIGLLSSQSSTMPPSQYRDGTPWFDLNDNTIKIRTDDRWANLAEVINLGDDDKLTLKDWYDSISQDVASIQSEMVFHGTIVTSNVTIIPMPANIASMVTSQSRSFVYINGLLINPALTVFEPGPNPTSIRVPPNSLSPGDEFVVVIKSIPNSRFNIQPVTV